MQAKEIKELVGLVEGQEPTDSQIRQVMKYLNIDYYYAQEILKCISCNKPIDIPNY